MLRKLLIISAACLLIFGTYKFAKAKNLLPSAVFSKIEEAIPNKITLPWNQEKAITWDNIKVNQEDLEKLGENGLTQIQILAEKAKEAGSVAQDFVEKSVQTEDTSSKNISEKAFEYGRYIYCQEVVKQYEASSSSEVDQ
jgi:hypothetical protein